MLDGGRARRGSSSGAGRTGPSRRPMGIMARLPEVWNAGDYNRNTGFRKTSQSVRFSITMPDTGWQKSSTTRSKQTLLKDATMSMKNSLIFDPTLSEEELRGFSRTVAEIEWLTVILVLLYQVIFSPGPEASVEPRARHAALRRLRARASTTSTSIARKATGRSRSRRG